MPNSGGYGNPLERDPELVLSDVLDVFTTLELAERDYGIVIETDTWTVDADATARLRKAYAGVAVSADEIDSAGSR